MASSFVIEAGGAAIGIVVRHRRGFRFYVSDRSFAALECCLFRRAGDAERSAALLMQALRETRQAEALPIDGTAVAVQGSEGRADFGDGRRRRAFASPRT